MKERRLQRKRSVCGLFLTLALLLGLAIPAQAAGIRLTYEKEGASAVRLTLRGLGEESVYGVQLELTLAGNHPSASFKAAGAEAYSPECHVLSSDSGTMVTVYVTSQKPLNSGGTLALGTLRLDTAFTMPRTVHLKLLGHELKPLPEANGVDVSAAEQSQSTGGGGGETAKSYRVRISSAENGAVTANVSEAEYRSEVLLTVTPAEGYALERLRVETLTGREMALTDVGGSRYTFHMPGADVEVTASFLWTGEIHIPMSFEDVVETDWYHDAVHFVFEKGMMTGTSETTFSPKMEVTRGMIVTILHRLDGSPRAGLSTFPDVPVTSYYAGAVDWAHTNGIVSGYGGNESGTFGPENNITREQLAAILYRYAGKKGYDTAVRGELTAFEDEGEISDYAREAMSWAVGTGLISGMGNGTIAPASTATRAQAATILQRFCRHVTG